jgi:hypothetical protein
MAAALRWNAIEASVSFVDLPKDVCGMVYPADFEELYVNGG